MRAAANRGCVRLGIALAKWRADRDGARLGELRALLTSLRAVSTLRVGGMGVSYCCLCMRVAENTLDRRRTHNSKCVHHAALVVPLTEGHKEAQEHSQDCGRDFGRIGIPLRHPHRLKKALPVATYAKAAMALSLPIFTIVT